MIFYIYAIVAIILFSTIKPQYLGMFKSISLENIISKSMVLNVRYSIIIAFLIYTCMNYACNIKEGIDYTTTELDAIQTEDLCKPDSNLTPEERKIVCDEENENVAQLMGNLNSSPSSASPSDDELENPVIMTTNPSFEPGTVEYGGTGYVPSYEEAAYNDDYKFKKQYEPIVNAEYQNSGFCEASVGDIDQKCKSLSKDICASTSCCVLVGGERCVQGNENGPTKKLVYSDTSIQNRDVYYYQGKCYGNCA